MLVIKEVCSLIARCKDKSLKNRVTLTGLLTLLNAEEYWLLVTKQSMKTFNDSVN